MYTSPVLSQVLYSFSIYAEAIVLLPQALMIYDLKQTDTAITNFYMFLLVCTCFGYSCRLCYPCFEFVSDAQRYG